MQPTLEESFADLLETIVNHQGDISAHLETATSLVTSALLSGNKLLCCGNGGSAANSQHLASKLMNRFERERPAFPAIALNTDGAILSAISNDFSASDMYARQVRALGQTDDILIVFTTSGQSANIVQAIQSAHTRDMQIIAFTGKDGGDVARLLQPDDIEIRIAVDKSARILEMHLFALHTLCENIDATILGSGE